MGGASVAVALTGEAAEVLLRYQRDAILHGQLWRLLTAHLVHLGPLHLVLNLIGLVLIWFGFLRPAPLSFGALLACFTCCALGTSLGLLLFMPELHWYVGLSGLLHGLAGAAALELWRDGRRIGAALAGLIAVKLIIEAASGPSSEGLLSVEGPVITEAHFYGTAGGALFSALRHAMKARKQVG